MGLDMYLYLEKYVSRNDYSNDAEGNFSVTIRPEFQAMTEMLGTDTLVRADDWTGYTVSVPVGYWRKANAIHGWIVNNCARGEDNCQRIWVGKEKATQLLNLCKQVLTDPTLANDLLPPTSGFFFGGYEIDEYYLNDLQQTIDIFEPLLANEDVCDSIYYQASW